MLFRSKTAKRGQGGGEVNIAVQERPGFIAGNRYQIAKPILEYKQGQGFAALNVYFPPQPDVVTAQVADEPDEEEVAA